jgi:hypothetical protein
MIADRINQPAAVEPSDVPSLVAYLRETVDALKSRLAVYEEVAVNYQLFKNAVIDSGVPRETLRRWTLTTPAKPPLVACYRDDHDQLWVDVIDARRVRFEQARVGG